MYDLIVIGGGPAGLTATTYAIRKHLNVLMVTKDLGGKTNYRLAIPWIQDYQVISGLETVNKFRSELEYLEFARHMDLADKVTKTKDHFIVTTRGGAEFKARAVIVATGTKQVRLDVPGEKQYIMKGLCYSALSYAALFLDRTTVIVGEGEMALRAAGELSTVCKQVYLVSSKGELPASPLASKLQSASNVKLLLGHEVVEVKGDEYARSVLVKNPKGKVTEIITDGTFIAMALNPNSKLVDGLVNLDPQGHIIVDSANRTNVPGIFAAGDVASGYAEQVLIAMGEGAKAALSAYEYLLPML